MRKPIRLLVENIFYDIYDIDQENNSTVEIADDIFNVVDLRIHLKIIIPDLYIQILNQLLSNGQQIEL